MTCSRVYPAKSTIQTRPQNLPTQSLRASERANRRGFLRSRRSVSAESRSISWLHLPSSWQCQIEYPVSSSSRTHRYTFTLALCEGRSAHPPCHPRCSYRGERNGREWRRRASLSCPPQNPLPLFSWLLLVLRTNAPLTCAPYHPHRWAKQNRHVHVHAYAQERARHPTRVYTLSRTRVPRGNEVRPLRWCSLFIDGHKTRRCAFFFGPLRARLSPKCGPRIVLRRLFRFRTLNAALETRIHAFSDERGADYPRILRVSPCFEIDSAVER